MTGIQPIEGEYVRDTIEIMSSDEPQTVVIYEDIPCNLDCCASREDCCVSREMIYPAFGPKHPLHIVDDDVFYGREVWADTIKNLQDKIDEMQARWDYRPEGSLVKKMWTECEKAIETANAE